MADATNFPTWEYQDKNIDASVDQPTKYTRGDRTILFSRLSGATKEFRPIGLVQGFTHSEQKQLQMLFELGSAAPMIIPGLATGQLSINRVLLSGADFMNVIYGTTITSTTDASGVTTFSGDDKVLRSLRDINKSFDLMLAKYPVNDPTTGLNASSTAAITEKQALSYIVFEGCQIQARSESISPGGVITVENLSVMYKQVSRKTYTDLTKA